MICYLDGCESVAKSRKMCSKHYQRWRASGDPTKVSKLVSQKTTPEERFWDRVDKTSDAKGCWLWLGSKVRGGYGQFNEGASNKCHFAHRYAWMQTKGSLTTGKVLDHICRVRHCVNPAHLQEVSQRINTQNQPVAGKATSSGYRNVSWSVANNKWKVKLTSQGVERYGGLYTDLQDAVKAAKLLRQKYFTNSQEF